MSAIEILAPGLLTTIQDEGRRGLGAIGVSRSGAADLDAYRAANRIVGNQPGAACLETTAGGLVARAHGRVLIAVTGPRTIVSVNGRPAGDHALIHLRDGDTVSVAAPTAGLRNYLALRGGVVGESVLGSLSTDVLSGLGPQPLVRGDLLRVGGRRAEWPAVEQIPTPAMRDRTQHLGAATLAISPGPRADWFADAALTTLTSQLWSVTPESNRVGVRLKGEKSLDRISPRELPSEGMATGSIQVPADGQPLLFLADHPVTGGYPVIAVLALRAISAAAQLRPGDGVRFRLS